MVFFVIEFDEKVDNKMANHNLLADDFAISDCFAGLI